MRYKSTELACEEMSPEQKDISTSKQALQMQMPINVLPFTTRWRVLNIVEPQRLRACMPIKTVNSSVRCEVCSRRGSHALCPESDEAMLRQGDGHRCRHDYGQNRSHGVLRPEPCHWLWQIAYPIRSQPQHSCRCCCCQHRPILDPAGPAAM